MSQLDCTKATWTGAIGCVILKSRLKRQKEVHHLFERSEADRAASAMTVNSASNHMVNMVIVTRCDFPPSHNSCSSPVCRAQCCPTTPPPSFPARFHSYRADGRHCNHGNCCRFHRSGLNVPFKSEWAKGGDGQLAWRDRAGTRRGDQERPGSLRCVSHVYQRRAIHS